MTDTTKAVLWAIFFTSCAHLLIIGPLIEYARNLQ